MINIPTQNEVASRLPQTELRLYSGVPWSGDYEHVRLYNSKLDLLNHLGAYQKIKIDNMTPIRIGNADVKIPYTEMSALHINYLAFCNHGISDEWVFCFVSDIEWLSEKTTRINWQLDVFQNNIYSINIKPCFVEFQHIPKSDDIIGANLVPVNLETGETEVTYHEKLNLTPDYCCVFATRGTVEQSWFDGKLENGVYNWGSIGVYQVTKESELEKLNDLLKAYNEQGAQDAVVGLFMSPQLCTKALGGAKIEPLKRHIPISSNAFGGYKPKNNKVYSYPWLYMLVDNNQGNTNIYRYEYSHDSNHQLTFYSYGTIATLPQVITTPVKYKTGEEYKHGLMSEAIVNSSFPQCSFSSDTYRAWLAQNKSSIALSQAKIAVDAISGTGNAIAGMYTAGKDGLSQSKSGLSSVTGALWEALSMSANMTDRARNAGVVHGKALSENVLTGIGEVGVDFYEMSCKREFAEMADSFFSQFGYPINRVVRPNLKSRSSWNYVKTSHCGFTGNVELEQLKVIRGIFDRGVTLWHTDDIGNYNLINN